MFASCVMCHTSMRPLCLCTTHKARRQNAARSANPTYTRDTGNSQINVREAAIGPKRSVPQQITITAIKIAIKAIQNEMRQHREAAPAPERSDRRPQVQCRSRSTQPKCGNKAERDVPKTGTANCAVSQLLPKSYLRGRWEGGEAPKSDMTIDQAASRDEGRRKQRYNNDKRCRCSSHKQLSVEPRATTDSCARADTSTEWVKL